MGLSLAGLVMILIGSALVRMSPKIYAIPTDSMSPTILPGDHIFCARPSKPVSQLARGTLITYDATLLGPPNAGTRLNRLVGFPGDRIEVVDGELVVNGMRLPSRGGERAQPPRFASPAFASQMPTYPLVVPEGKVFVLGDHYSNSLDSRYLGPIPIQAIQRIALRRVRPFSRVGRIE